MFTINGVVWKLKFAAPGHPMLIRPDGVRAAGVCDANTRTIYIDNTIKGAYFKEVLCHEIVHAAIFSYKIELDYDTEELVANLIAKYGHEIIAVTNTLFKKMKKGYR